MTILSILFFSLTITNVVMVHCIEPSTTSQTLPLSTSKTLSKPDLCWQGECKNWACVDEHSKPSNIWPMPIHKSGEKTYYIGFFFKTNWYHALEFCRYHSMHLASITNQEENDKLEKQIRAIGLGNERFWISGNDLGKKGALFWASTGQPVTYTNWMPGEPFYATYNNEVEHCFEFWNLENKGFKWNNHICSFDKYFVCEF